MSQFLLDFAFPISEVVGTPEASTDFLRQVAVIAKPKTGQTGNVGNLYLCTTMADVAARTDNLNAQKLFDAGLSRVYVLLASTLSLATYMATHKGKFFTALIADDFVDGDVTVVTTPEVKASLKVQDILYRAKGVGVAGNAVTIAYANTNTGGAATASVSTNAITVSIETGVTKAVTVFKAICDSAPAFALVQPILDVGDENLTQVTATTASLSGGVNSSSSSGALDVGTYDGVVGYSSTTESFAKTFATPANRVGFFTNGTTKAGNMFFAFGKLLANQTTWLNQQYIAMPLTGEVTDLGTAELYFADRVSFVILDDQYGNRLGMFAAGGKAIIAPYILKNIKIDLQSAALNYMALNNPQHTVRECSLMETRLQIDVLDEDYINKNLIVSGVVNIVLTGNNFTAQGSIVVSEPTALWRVVNQMTIV